MLAGLLRKENAKLHNIQFVDLLILEKAYDTPLQKEVLAVSANKSSDVHGKHFHHVGKSVT